MAGKTEKPKPQKKPDRSPTQAITITLNVDKIQDILKQVRDDGYLSGFHDGAKYIVTLAENFMVEHEKLGTREALTRDSKLIPTWWIATLVKALHYELPHTPGAKAPHKVLQDEPRELDE
jgi:hypothetical protein